MIAQALRSMSDYQPWWLAIRYKEVEVLNAREEISRLDGILGYSHEILMVIFESAGFASQKGEGYVVRKDEWVAMFSWYNLTNEKS